mmetsp:Transcript_27986/g.59949  ORF Transcript_27986/g.59949 Transcript_27986/m.59949 type:complete len:136 (-) Transcript_27986:1714-2121(-)
MSLFWNWGSRNVLRRCTPPSSFTGAAFPKSSTLSSSPSASIISSRPLYSRFSTPFSLSFHLWTPVRFKSGVKTNSGCKKRFRVRGSGSIKRGKAGKSHNTGYLKRQRANRLGHSTGVQGKKIEQRVRKSLGVFNG